MVTHNNDKYCVLIYLIVSFTIVNSVHLDMSKHKFILLVNTHLLFTSDQQLWVLKLEKLLLMESQ